ncbi:hypothetical protein ACFU53_09845 [Streptomyces sp. NPDC057474]|uniref:hypothetical protein n=1 Tax=Streptomyces sp. NPDC057474 TaxID=3346144 RepID=UPI003695774A
MLWMEFLLAALGVGLQLLVHWQFGPLGFVGVCLLGIGLRTRNMTCILVAGLLLALLLNPS